MLDTLKKSLFSHYQPGEHKGLFVSVFATDKSLLYSQGVLQPKTGLTETLNNLYTIVVEPRDKSIAYAVLDVVTDIVEVNDTASILEYDPQEYGFAAIDGDDDVSGVLLPNTAGIADAKGALYAMKAKYAIHGKIGLFVFRTERIVVAR